MERMKRRTKKRRMGKQTSPKRLLRRLLQRKKAAQKLQKKKRGKKHSLAVTLDLSLSAYANAREHHARRKKHEVKLTKTVNQNERALLASKAQGDGKKKTGFKKHENGHDLHANPRVVREVSLVCHYGGVFGVIGEGSKPVRFAYQEVPGAARRVCESGRGGRARDGRQGSGFSEHRKRCQRCAD
mmetsp:Transcript_2561/g.8968  ORF Transcript_2561/g.8968 Transcript_2561/m.8968 type:complete len:185 (-) Transcript_2561:1865-2419(-)